MRKPRALLLIAFATCAAVRLATAAPPSPADELFAKFWAAAHPEEAASAAEEVVKTGVSFEEALARLKRGRPYSPDAPRGLVYLSHYFDSQEFAYWVEVPENYDPARKYQVRVQLHGGVSRGDSRPRGYGIGALAGAEQIYVLPSAWVRAPWWGGKQLLNLRVILDGVKRTYNVDENAVALAGVSDGATGTYYFAMQDTTAFASFLPLNGALAVLRNPDNGVEGDLFLNNLLNKPFFIVNGGQDPLYPTKLVEPYIDHLKKGGVDVTYRPQPQGAHNTEWWPDVKDSFEAFVRAHPRRPYPDTLTWETNLTNYTGRTHWLVIDELSSNATGDGPLPDLNEFTALSQPMFMHHTLSGRVDLMREGNTVRAKTRHVGAFTLLLSPDVFDFDRPVKVIADGKTVFDGRVTKDVGTLMRWAAHDNDRTMLFGAEVHVRLAP